jgi:hypothetical protein
VRKEVVKKVIKKPVSKVKQKVVKKPTEKKVGAKKPFSKPDDSGTKVTMEKKMTMDSVSGVRPRVWLIYSKTVQVNDYEPAKIDVGISDDVRDGESFDDAYKRLSVPLEKKITTEVKSLLKAKKGEN